MGSPMNIELLSALVLFALVSSITPGPNNLMLMTSGVNFGFRPSMPHMLGVSLGFVLMTLLVGIGVMQLFDRYPISYQILKLLSVAYMLFLAYKIATASRPISEQQERSEPLSFVQAALFQWVNPKAWTMALTAITLYAPSKSFSSVLWVSFVFGIINFPCIACWTGLGTKLRHWLDYPKALRLFNIGMAVLLISSLYPLLV